MRCFKNGDFGMHGISSLKNQRAFVAVQVGEVEEAALSGGSLVYENPRETGKLHVIIKNDDEDWNFESTMTAEESQ